MAVRRDRRVERRAVAGRAVGRARHQRRDPRLPVLAIQLGEAIHGPRLQRGRCRVEQHEATAVGHAGGRAELVALDTAGARADPLERDGSGLVEDAVRVGIPVAQVGIADAVCVRSDQRAVGSEQHEPAVGGEHGAWVLRGALLASHAFAHADSAHSPRLIEYAVAIRIAVADEDIAGAVRARRAPDCSPRR